MGNPAHSASDFASAMQHLSAQAEKAPLGHEARREQNSQLGEQLSEATWEVRALASRVENLEGTLERHLRDIAETMVATQAPDIRPELKKIDDQLTSVRNTESVNQKLFDSLHHELISYRDNFLHESLQKPFIRDLIVLFDDLSGLLAQLQSAVDGNDGERNPVSLWHNNLENSLHSIVEILHRLEVSEIEPMEVVDRIYHRVVSYEPADFAEEDGQIVQRVRRGFMWRDKVLRPEQVIAKRFS